MEFADLKLIGLFVIHASLLDTNFSSYAYKHLHRWITHIYKSEVFLRSECINAMFDNATAAKYCTVPLSHHYLDIDVDDNQYKNTRMHQLNYARALNMRSNVCYALLWDVIRCDTMWRGAICIHRHAYIFALKTLTISNSHERFCFNYAIINAININYCN